MVDSFISTPQSLGMKLFGQFSYLFKKWRQKFLSKLLRWLGIIEIKVTVENWTTVFQDKKIEKENQLLVTMIRLIVACALEPVVFKSFVLIKTRRPRMRQILIDDHFRGRNVRFPLDELNDRVYFHVGRQYVVSKVAAEVLIVGKSGQLQINFNVPRCKRM